MKEIKAFREEDYGWFLDLVDADASVAVDVRTGDILLDEGGAISRSAFHDFCLEKSHGSRYQLVLKYSLVGSDVLGITSNEKRAKEWISGAKSAIRSPLKLKDLPVRHPPFDLPENCAPPFYWRERNSRVGNITLVLEPWGERYTMEPHAAFDVAFFGAPGERLEIERSDGAITVKAGRRSVVRLFAARLGLFRGTCPSEIVKEELQRARQLGEFELSKDGAAELRSRLSFADDTILATDAPPSRGPEDGYQWSSTIAIILAQHSHSEYRLKRETVWRISARILQLVDRAFELFESATDDWLRRVVGDCDEAENWKWLESHSWDGRAPLEPSVPTEGTASTRPNNDTAG